MAGTAERVGVRVLKQQKRVGYLASTGRISIKNARFRDDGRPLDENCGCYTCATHSRAYLRHLFQANEILFSTLASLHNIRRYLDIMREIRQAIILGKFPEYLRASQTTAVELS